MTAVALALMAAYGSYLIFTGVALRWQGLGLGPRRSRRRPPNLAALARGAGAPAGTEAEFVSVSAALALMGGLATFAVFGGVVAPALGAAFAATAPAAAQRHRRERQRRAARDAWPRMIEEIRILTGSLGRPIPQALLEAGKRGPAELRPAFAAAEREWLITTDFGSAIQVLKDLLGDATADAACETLLVAHEVGGTDVDRRLAALAEDRVQDAQGRKDAVAKQAGVRFARRFVLIVPLGMALAGLSIGTGRAAYQTALGQAGVALGIAAVAACWLWAGQLMRLPEEDRVFP